MRKDKAEGNAKRQGASPDAEASFDRFAEFAGKVVAVPKREIDEQERRYRKRRAKASNSKQKSL